jgi:hypothetical protein
MELTLTHHMIDDVEPQDLAMEAFRKQFRLVACCEVSADGLTMRYQLKTMSGANTWLGHANSIIIANKLPLKAGIRSVMKDKEVIRIELRIVYKP